MNDYTVSSNSGIQIDNFTSPFTTIGDEEPEEMYEDKEDGAEADPQSVRKARKLLASSRSLCICLFRV